MSIKTKFRGVARTANISETATAATMTLRYEEVTVAVFKTNKNGLPATNKLQPRPHAQNAVEVCLLNENGLPATNKL